MPFVSTVIYSSTQGLVLLAGGDADSVVSELEELSENVWGGGLWCPLPRIFERRLCPILFTPCGFLSLVAYILFILLARRHLYSKPSITRKVDIPVSKKMNSCALQKTIVEMK